jgi:hypothetical protein
MVRGNVALTSEWKKAYVFFCFIQVSSHISNNFFCYTSVTDARRSLQIILKQITSTAVDSNGLAKNMLQIVVASTPIRKTIQQAGRIRHQGNISGSLQLDLPLRSPRLSWPSWRSVKHLLFIIAHTYHKLFKASTRFGQRTRLKSEGQALLWPISVKIRLPNWKESWRSVIKLSKIWGEKWLWWGTFLVVKKSGSFCLLLLPNWYHDYYFVCYCKNKKKKITIKWHYIRLQFGCEIHLCQIIHGWIRMYEFADTNYLPQYVM